MPKSLKVLIVEDSEHDLELLLRALRQGGYEPVYTRVETAPAMTAALDREAWDIVLADYSMPGFSGQAALALLKERGTDIPFIVVSGSIGEENAVGILKAGAQDFVLKDRPARLIPAIERELREAEGRRARRSLEEQLRHAQKMEAVGQLAGGIAHDFNNVLTAILGYGELLQRAIDPSSPLFTKVEHILAAGERAAGLTKQLLAFSRKQVIELRVLDLDEVARKIAPMLRRLIGEHIELQLISTKGLGRVKADRGQMEQIIMNLAVNARDAMPNGGSLVIRTDNVELQEGDLRHAPNAPPGRYIKLTVSDTGCGMSEDTLARIFEPFFTTKEPGKGTGLGLATVYGIVQQSGGCLGVDSELHHGTTFTIYLPRVDEALTALAPPRSKPQSLRGSEVVLLVEDEDVVEKLIRLALTQEGYTVLEAHTALEACRLCEDHPTPIHLLITDVIMPQMNGRALAEGIAVLRPTMKILYMSGYANVMLTQDGALDPGIAFLQKPFTAETLVRKVREVLDS
jgi:signal transduction histidine kinase